MLVVSVSSVGGGAGAGCGAGIRVSSFSVTPVWSVRVRPLERWYVSVMLAKSFRRRSVRSRRSMSSSLEAILL